MNTIVSSQKGESTVDEKNEIVHPSPFMEESQSVWKEVYGAREVEKNKIWNGNRKKCREMMEVAMYFMFVCGWWIRCDVYIFLCVALFFSLLWYLQAAPPKLQ